MAASVLPQSSTIEPIHDEEVIARVLAGETALFEVIMRRYNQRLYRAARAILHDEAQAEDVMQAAYVNAYEHLRQFSCRAPFGAWITRIAVNEALARLRTARRFDDPEDKGAGMDRFASTSPDPERAATSSEIRQLLETLIDGLPPPSRTVFMLRDVEGMSTTETSEALGITEENVKVRLHRARAALRNGLATHAIHESQNVFSFHAIRCDRVVANVFRQISLLPPAENSAPQD
jgi:RNA polymerase sigma-70 factor, ECF subfamily